MKVYKNKITLIRNNRGCYIIDTIKGCSLCMDNYLGCYDNCYAANIAKRYNFNFSNPVYRDFEKDNNQINLCGFLNTNHESIIIKKIKRIKMPFVRIGEMGEPSENWEHTFNICEVISKAKKPIVIITKHINKIPLDFLQKLNDLNICINTSISALDSDNNIKYRLEQYEILKSYCKSILRVVTCDFNKNSYEGKIFSAKQNILLKRSNVIETVFRPYKTNRLVKDNIINVSMQKFLKSKVIASKNKDSTYFGYCYNCPDMCGINK